MDFRCPIHGFFEHSEPLSAPVSECAPCPTCRSLSPKVWLKAPDLGKIQKGTFVVDFPVGDPRARKFMTMTRDEAEERISAKSGVTSGVSAERAEQIVNRAIGQFEKRQAGEIPPIEQPTEAQMATLERDLKKAGVVATATE